MPPKSTDSKLIPFGCLVDFLPRPDTVRAMPKFEPRACQGILVGYRLHPGGTWAKDYHAFPLSYFTDYDFNHPRQWHELFPITTQEVKLSREFTVPLKARYEARKRLLPN